MEKTITGMGLGMCTFVLMGQEDLTDKVMFKKKLKGSEGMSHVGRERGLHSPQVGLFPAYLRRSQLAGVA